MDSVGVVHSAAWIYLNLSKQRVKYRKARNVRKQRTMKATSKWMWHRRILFPSVRQAGVWCINYPGEQPSERALCVCDKPHNGNLKSKIIRKPKTRGRLVRRQRQWHGRRRNKLEFQFSTFIPFVRRLPTLFKHTERPTRRLYFANMRSLVVSRRRRSGKGLRRHQCVREMEVGAASWGGYQSFQVAPNDPRAGRLKRGNLHTQ